MSAGAHPNRVVRSGRVPASQPSSRKAEAVTRFLLTGALLAGALLPAAARAEAPCVVSVEIGTPCPDGCRQFFQAAELQVCLVRSS